jgi:hypothetical protein
MQSVAQQDLFLVADNGLLKWKKNGTDRWRYEKSGRLIHQNGQSVYVNWNYNGNNNNDVKLSNRGGMSVVKLAPYATNKVEA